MISISGNLQSPLVILILQIAVILIFTRFLVYCLKRTRQPDVIAEIIAGILLGPSLLGLFFPSVSAFLFPERSMNNLHTVSQVGLILFMFVIGTEVDMSYLQKQVRAAVIISQVGIIFPLILGMGAAFFLYDRFAGNISFLSFALFIGISMSITAFPVLARIIKERGMMHNRISSMAISCAASNDIIAWCLLAVAIAIVKTGSFVNSLYTILLVAGYVLFMCFAVRPFVKWLLLRNAAADGSAITRRMMTVIFLLLLLSSCITELIGIHALFGAFLAGVIMPADPVVRKGFVDKIEHVSVILLLPLFFVFSGLRTRIEALNEWHLWMICLGLIAAAIVGKFGGTALAARSVGYNGRDSIAIGALMNTRGLVELIVLNIGYELGILSPVVFTMMVLMALVTTLMTCPVLDLIKV